MNLILWLIAGAALGALTTLIVRNRRTDLTFNLILGIFGAIAAGYLLTPLFHFNPTNQGIINFPALIVSVLGTAALLAIVSFLRRERDVKGSTINQKWEQVSPKMQTRWGKLTDKDVDKINGNHSQLIVALQERYGYAKKEAEDKIQRFLKATLHY